jgi:hypothetical protein
MEDSIESIWTKGFLHENSLVAPKINDLYNQKSKHVVDRVKRMFRINQRMIVAMSIILPVIHYFVDALWQGLAASVLLLLTGWYNHRVLIGIKTLDTGATSLDYLKSFDRWLTDVLLKTKRIVRFSYPLYVLISISTIWSAWSKQGVTLKIHQKFPDLLPPEHLPIIALVLAGGLALLMFCFSTKIYQWEMRLTYGRVFDKVKDTIAEMETLNGDN